jgi:tetratricopeptide (TPR) repeat protein
MTDYDLELESSRKTLEAAERAGDISAVLKTRHHMGTVFQKRGDYDGALECYHKALELAESAGNNE